MVLGKVGLCNRTRVAGCLLTIQGNSNLLCDAPPTGAPTLSSDGTRKALLDRITDFLDKHVKGLE